MRRTGVCRCSSFRSTLGLFLLLSAATRKLRFTIPKDEIKFPYIFRLLDEYQLTFVVLVPSILNYLRPYFDELSFPALKHSLFCGEALMEDVIREWAACAPYAAIYNVYGPTENTILCTAYLYQRDATNKTQKGILSIGQPMYGNHVIIVDEDLHVLGPDEEGECCLSGGQLTTGYWNSEVRTKASFFAKTTGGQTARYYRPATGAVLMRMEISITSAGWISR